MRSPRCQMPMRQRAAIQRSGVLLDWELHSDRSHRLGQVRGPAVQSPHGALSRADSTYNLGLDGFCILFMGVAHDITHLRHQVALVGRLVSHDCCCTLIRRYPCDMEWPLTRSLGRRDTYELQHHRAYVDLPHYTLEVSPDIDRRTVGRLGFGYHLFQVEPENLQGLWFWCKCLELVIL